MLLAIGLLSFTLVLLLTALYLPLAARFRWLDIPNHRSSHEFVTPGSGGMAIVAGLICGLLILLYAGYWPAGEEGMYMLGLLAALCTLGAWDDRHSVPVLPRLVLFLLLSALAVLCFWPSAGAPNWLFPLVALAMAWQLNLYNFMDGIDGIAALQCLLAAGGLAVLGSVADAPPAFPILAVATAGAYAGFLVFNWPPARLFMGDAGSLSAGFLLGWLGLWLWRDALLPVPIWLLLMSPFLLDSGVTLALRIKRRERLSEAHRSHCYQRLSRHWGSHRRVDYALLILHVLWLFPLSLLTVSGRLSPWTSLALGLFPQLLLMVKFRRLQ
jgi:Fuc2NAc and GlcNAc transferase